MIMKWQNAVIGKVPRLLSLPNNIIPTCPYSYHYQYSNRCDLLQGVLIQKNHLIKSKEKLQNLLLPLNIFF